ncbi:MAG: hypothetical protein JNL98_35925 [Bryobacterales bacterium]|nr:hypothetical protein [Bryobacterales bacterium]
MLFHRCFVDVTGQATYKHNMWVGKETYERQPLGGSVQGHQWLPKALRPLDLKAKPGQNFRQYATDWEQRCSMLGASSGGTLLYPVVAPQETPAGLPVIAHYGVVGGSNIIIPRSHSKPRGWPSIRSLLEQDVPVFVTNQPASWNLRWDQSKKPTKRQR